MNKYFNALILCDYGVYKIPNGFAIADPIDGADGFYLEGSNLDSLCKKAADTTLSDAIKDKLQL